MEAVSGLGREEEMERIIQILLRKRKNNCCLVGPAGVGKTAVVEGLAQRIAQGRVPSRLRGKQLYSLDLGQLVAGRLKLALEATCQGGHEVPG